MAVADSGNHPMTVPGGDARFRVSLMVPSTCDSATVLIQPTPPTPESPPAYIASVMASDADD